jgi:hypothetical protein
VIYWAETLASRTAGKLSDLTSIGQFDVNSMVPFLFTLRKLSFVTASGREHPSKESINTCAGPE